MSRYVAVILAGGSGTRFGADVPKQFLEIDGRMLIEYAVDAFQENPHIDEIAIVCWEDFLPLVEATFRKERYSKVKRFLTGGTERYHSSLAAIEAYGDDDYLLFHDAVRPLVSQRIINDCVEALGRYDAVNVGVKAVDTIFEIDSAACIVNVPKRLALRKGQSPQGFKRSVIRRAYQIALADPDFVTTDDCGVVVKYMPDVPVFVVEGEPVNIKVTYPQDIDLLSLYLIRSDV